MAQFIGLIVYQLVALLFSPLFWIVVLIIGFQTRRASKMKSEFFQLPAEGIALKTVQGIGFGLMGGVIGSILLVLLGVSVYEIGIEYLWIIAIILIFFNQRLMCFAYSGGILALSYYIFGWPQINIGQLMALIGVLHFVEAILIWCSGHLQAVPIYIKGREGTLIGGFNMQNFWPLPLVALTATLVPNFYPSADIMMMPDWWPILPMTQLGNSVHSNMIYSMLPVLAALGYSDLALTTGVKEKTKISALQLLVYSVILLALAIVASRSPGLAILPALFAPLGHECLIRVGQKREMTGDYYFVAPAQGVMILDVIVRSPSAQAGLRSGDIILTIDQMALENNRDYFACQNIFFKQMTIGYQRGQEIKQCRLERFEGQHLGIILVPDPYGREYLDFGRQSSLWRMIKGKWQKMKKKLFEKG